jgi:uncharacterized membrane protein
VACSLYTVVAAMLLIAVPALPTVVRVPLALPLLLFTPGYAVVAAAFPPVRTRQPGGDGPADGPAPRPGLAALERGAVATFVSLATVPMVALVTTPLVGVRASVVLAGVVAVTLVATAVGLHRDPLALRADRPAPTAVARTAVARTWATANRGFTPVAIVLVVVLLASTAAVSMTGGDDAPRTEFYLVDDAGDDADQARAAGDDYHLRLAHHGDRSREYTVVVEATVGDGPADDRSRRRLDRFSTTVAPAETRSATVPVPEDLEPGSTVHFLLYRGEAPADPDRASAHRTLRVTHRPSSE